MLKLQQYNRYYGEVSKDRTNYIFFFHDYLNNCRTLIINEVAE